VNAPAGFGTSDANREISTQLSVWWKAHRRGRVTESSAGFFLPDGSAIVPTQPILPRNKRVVLLEMTSTTSFASHRLSSLSYFQNRTG